MTEEANKVLGIRQLPIFPLPLVLMPHELLPLHIFEPRYREMLSDVTAGKNMFGISLFEPSESGPERPAEGSVGCVAEIREAQTLEDGRSNLLTVGVIRYRLNSYVDGPEPYLIAEIDFFEDEEEDAETLTPLSDEVFDLFKRMAVAAHKMSGQSGALPDLPKAEPQQLSFLVSAAFNLDNSLKYKLLKMTRTSRRLAQLKDVLSRSVGQVEETVKINKVSRTNGHVKKKLDID